MRALILSFVVLAGSPAVAASADPSEEALLVFVRLSSGKLVPVGAWKSDLPAVVKDVVAVREPGAATNGWLWRAGVSLDDRLSLDASGVVSGEVFDLAASKPVPTEGFQIELKTIMGVRVGVSVRPQTTILEIKKAFQAAQGMPIERLHFVFQGKTADDMRTVAEMGIGPGSRIDVVFKPAKRD